MMMESLFPSLGYVNLNFYNKCHMPCVLYVINLIVYEGLRCIETLEVFIIEQMTYFVDDNELLILFNTLTLMGDN